MASEYYHFNTNQCKNLLRYLIFYFSVFDISVYFTKEYLNAEITFQVLDRNQHESGGYM